MDTNTQTSSNNCIKSVEIRTDIGTLHVELGTYKGLSSPEQKTLAVTDLEIEQELQAYRERNAKQEVMEDGVVQSGDITKIDFEGYIDGAVFEGGTGKNQLLEIGSGSFIPSFEEQMIGMKANEEKQIQVQFPSNYHANKLAGKSATFKVKVTEITRKCLPNLDDNMAKSNSYCKTLEELKVDIKKNLTARKEMEASKYQRDLLVSNVVKNSKVEIPAQLVDLEVNRMIEDLEHQVQSQGITVEKYLEYAGISRKEFDAQFRTEASKRVQTQLVLQAITKAERLHVTEQDIANEINNIATTYKKNPDDIRSHLINQGNYTSFKTELAMRKAVELIFRNSI